LALCATSCSEKNPTQPTSSIYGPQAAATFSIDNEPCVAPETGQVSCRFVVTSPGFLGIQGGFAQYDPFYNYNWRFTNPANGRGVNVTGSSWSPPMDCTFAAGMRTFPVTVRLTVYRANDYFTEGTGTVQITRPPGACGT
jgi:hypothetical protein